MYGGAFGNKQDSVFPNLEVKPYSYIISTTVSYLSQASLRGSSLFMVYYCVTPGIVIIMFCLSCVTGGSHVLILPSGVTCGVLACLQCSDWPAPGPIGHLPSVHGPWDAQPAETQCILACPAGVPLALWHRVGTAISGIWYVKENTLETMLIYCCMLSIFWQWGYTCHHLCCVQLGVIWGSMKHTHCPCDSCHILDASNLCYICLCTQVISLLWSCYKGWFLPQIIVVLFTISWSDSLAGLIWCLLKRFSVEMVSRSHSQSEPWNKIHLVCVARRCSG